MIGTDSATSKTLITINKEFYRPSEVDLLIGDATKAKNELGWESLTSIDDLTKLMINEDLERNK